MIWMRKKKTVNYDALVPELRARYDREYEKVNNEHFQKMLEDAYVIGYMEGMKDEKIKS